MLTTDSKELPRGAVTEPFQSDTQPTPQLSRRFRGFNAAAHGLRGLASIMVLLAHIIGGTARHIYPQNAAYVKGIEHPWYLGTFGVEIFFVISGFVILPSALKYDISQFAMRRFFRIYPLFFTFSIIFIVLNYMTNTQAHLNNARSIIAGLLFLNLFTGTDQLTPNAWSLSFEVAFYALTALVVTFVIRRRSVWAGPLSIVAAVAFLIAFPITVYFLIGVLMRLFAPIGTNATHVTRTLELTALAALVWFASRAHFDYTSWTQFTNFVVPNIIISISIYFFMALMNDSFTMRLLDNRSFRYFGDVSYSLYLVHPFTYFIARMIFVRYGYFTQDIAVSMTLFAIIVIASSFLVTHFVHAMLERWPYQAVFHQKVYRQKAARP